MESGGGGGGGMVRGGGSDGGGPGQCPGQGVAGQEEGGVAGAGLTCPLGPGSPDSPCRYTAARSRPSEAPGSAPRPAGRPRAANSPSRLSLPGGRPPPGRPANEAQRVSAPADPHRPPPPPLGTRGRGGAGTHHAAAGSGLPRGALQQAGSQGLGEFPSPGTVGSTGSSTTTPGSWPHPSAAPPRPPGPRGTRPITFSRKTWSAQEGSN